MYTKPGGWTAVVPYPGGRGPPGQKKHRASPSLQSGTVTHLLANREKDNDN
ncbi:MAG: hypothetical protein HY268_34230 [Deltaproteobacteria bacterium]|nr:hypothetical protein [Deltaproteobacteria bacterium]